METLGGKADDLLTYLRTCCADKSHIHKVNTVTRTLVEVRNEALEEAALIADEDKGTLATRVAARIRQLKGEA